MRPAAPEFEIHFAAERSSQGRLLHDRLIELGFQDDPLAFPGVVYPRFAERGFTSCPLLDVHVTWSTYERKTYLSMLSSFKRTLEGYGECVDGYAHAEIIQPEWDIPIELSKFDRSISVPVRRLNSVKCDSPKIWDMHFSLSRDTLVPELENLLHLELGFHYIDLRKPHGVFRIFTIQGSEDIPGARSLFFQIVEWLRGVGGCEGSAKFEQTIYWKTLGQPSCLPPQLAKKASSFI